MSVEATLEEVEGLPCVLLRGLEGTEQDLRSVASLLALPGFRPELCWLIDNRALAAVPGREDVVRLARFFERHGSAIGRTRGALVVSGEASFGMGRMLEFLSENAPLRLRTFRGLEAALAWLREEPSRPGSS